MIPYLLKLCSLFFKPSTFSKGMGIISSTCLVVAFIAEYKYGILPCPLCFYERFIFAGLIIVALLSCYKPALIPFHFLVLGAGLFLTFYHIGVEHHWWSSPASCAASLKAENLDQLRSLILNKKPVACDKAGWVILNISAVTWCFFLFLCFFGGLLLSYLNPSKR